jgi:DNA polymerase I
MIYFINSQGSFDYNDIKTKNISLTEALQKLDRYDIISLDTETTGLSPFNDTITTIQLGDLDNQYVFDMRDCDITKLKILLESNKTFIIHNAKFDYSMLKANNITLSNVYCTKLAEIILNNGKYSKSDLEKLHPFSLKNVYKRYFGIDIDKDTRESFIGFKGPLTTQQITYAANDIIYALEVYNKQQPLIDKLNVRPCVDLENKTVFALADMELNGVRINTSKWLDLAKSNTIKLEKTVEELDNALFNNVESLISKYRVTSWQQELFDPTWEPRKCSVNWASPEQVLAILTNVFKLSPTNKKDKPSTDEYSLTPLKDHQFVSILLKHRELAKAISTYGESFILKYLQKDGKIHTTYNQIVDTGRLSSLDPNMQNIPALEEFRNCFIADEDNLLVIGDYSSQEPRITADKSNEEVLIDFYINGHGDGHTLTTSRMYSIIEGKEINIPPKIDEDPIALAKHYAHPFACKRKIGKIMSLKMDYGGSAYTIKDILGVSEKEAQKFVDAYWAAYPSKKTYFDKCSEFVREHGYMRANNITNRIEYFREYGYYSNLVKQRLTGQLSRDERITLMKLQGDMERAAGNMTIQGTASDMTKTALVYARERLNKYDAKLLLQVHDEIVIMANKNIVEEVSIILKQSMEEAGEVFCKRVPMKVHPTISPFWTKK